MTVRFKEMGGSPVEMFGPDGMSAERRVLVEWENRRAFVIECLGDGFSYGGTTLVDYPGTDGIKAMRMRIEPFTNRPTEQGSFTAIETNLNSYDREEANKFDNPCVVTITYEVLPIVERDDLPDIEDGTFLTYRMQFGGEYLEVPGSCVAWEDEPDSPVPPETHIRRTIRLPVVEHHLDWHRVINPPWQAIAKSIGTLNDAAIAGAALGQVMFDGCDAEKEFTWLGNFLAPEFGWRVSYVFRERRVSILGADKLDVGWNHFFRTKPANAPGWDRLLTPDGDTVYETSDFNELFRGAITN